MDMQWVCRPLTSCAQQCVSFVVGVGLCMSVAPEAVGSAEVRFRDGPGLFVYSCVVLDHPSGTTPL